MALGPSRTGKIVEGGFSASLGAPRARSGAFKLQAGCMYHHSWPVWPELALLPLLSLLSFSSPCDGTDVQPGLEHTCTTPQCATNCLKRWLFMHSLSTSAFVASDVVTVQGHVVVGHVATSAPPEMDPAPTSEHIHKNDSHHPCG